jgi:hypothetical protein
VFLFTEEDCYFCLINDRRVDASSASANILSWTFFKVCAFLATLAAGTLSFDMCTLCFLLKYLIYLLCPLSRSRCTNERVPAARVARNAQTLKNVHERMFAEAEDAGK